MYKKIICAFLLFMNSFAYAEEHPNYLFSSFQVDEPAKYKSNNQETYWYLFNKVKEQIFAYNDICIRGKIIISFVVNKDGQVKHIKIIENDLKGVIENDAIIQIVESTGMWTPAYHEGVSVNTLVLYPIIFQ